MAQFPNRSDNSPTGSQFIQSIIDMKMTDKRDDLVANQILQGNFPDFLRKLVNITISEKGNTLIYKVMPDFLSIGSDQDYQRIPLTAPSAQKIADAFNCVLPTPKMSDQIWKNATKLPPKPLSGMTSTIRDKTYSPESFVAQKMIDMDSVQYHNSIVNKQLVNVEPGQLIAGHLKDIVISDQLINKKRLGLHGLHTLDGKPIQEGALSAHNDTHFEYAMGTRLVDRQAMLNGKQVDLVNDILKNKDYAYLISNEGPLQFTSYQYEKPALENKITQDTNKNYIPSDFRTVKESELTDDVKRESWKILDQMIKDKSVIGSTKQFISDNENWLARLEIHDHPPQGKHPGITVYKQKYNQQTKPITEDKVSGRISLLERLNKVLDKLNV